MLHTMSHTGFAYKWRPEGFRQEGGRKETIKLMWTQRKRKWGRDFSTLPLLCVRQSLKKIKSMGIWSL